MDTNKKIEEIIGLILLIGIIISLIFVLIGGVLFLLQAGHESLDTELLQAGNHHITLQHIWNTLIIFSPIGLIELGLYLLVITQVLRVAMLAIVYLSIKDYWFAGTSSFVLLVLVYSLFIRAG